MKTKQYRAVLFDVDGTLLDFNLAERTGVSEVMKAYGVEPDADKVALYHEINQGQWRRYEKGEISKDQIMETRFSLFFKELGKSVTGPEAEKIYRAQLDDCAALIDGAEEICRYLSALYPMYVVTNGVSATQYKRLAKSGLDQYFKAVFVSEDAGSQKPQKEFFDYCFSRIPEIGPADMIVIGDSLSSDMLGGSRAGTDTCWFNPDRAENDSGVQITYEIQKLLELKSFL